MLLAAGPAAIADPIDPAQAIAQKFFEADQPRAPQPSKAPVAKAKPTPARTAIDRTALPSSPPAQPVPATAPAEIAKAAPKPERPGADYETDMLRRARVEDAERHKSSREQAITERASAPVTSPSSPPDPLPIAAIARPAPAAIPQPAAELQPGPLLEPEPQRAWEPAARNTMRPEPVLPTAVAQAAASVEPAPAPAATRATILLVLDPDGAPANVKPDPIICFDQQCWISNGLDDPAKPLPRSEAIALKTTDTPTGDSCSGKSACAFRNVAFEPGSQIQVVEVGESRGVAEGAYTVAADATCRKSDGDLTCDNALVTHAFRIWVVPEATAQAAGASTLEDAVADGLQDDDDDSVTDGK